PLTVPRWWTKTASGRIRNRPVAGPIPGLARFYRTRPGLPRARFAEGFRTTRWPGFAARPPSRRPSGLVVWPGTLPPHLVSASLVAILPPAFPEARLPPDPLRRRRPLVSEF